MRVLTPVVPTKVVAMAASIDSRLDGIGAGGLLAQSEQLYPSLIDIRGGRVVRDEAAFRITGAFGQLLSLPRLEFQLSFFAQTISSS